MVKNETLAEYSLGYGFDKRAKLPSDLWVEGLGRKKLWVKTMGDIFEVRDRDPALTVVQWLDIGLSRQHADSAFLRRRTLQQSSSPTQRTA